jgi:hypothetical protein
MALSRMLAFVAALAALAIAASSAEAATYIHFKSPSGNINCAIGAGGGGPDAASCVVRSERWPRHPAKPRSCRLDWADTEIDLTGTRVHLGSCRGDIGPLCIRGAGPCSTLRYGRSLRVGHVRCVSATAGITCRRTDGRRVGFRIAREGYRVYR